MLLPAVIHTDPRLLVFAELTPKLIHNLFKVTFYDPQYTLPHLGIRTSCFPNATVSLLPSPMLLLREI